MIDFDKPISDRLVLGTAGLAGLWGPVDPAESLRTLLLAFEAGILHVDTAPAYAHAQTLVGRALEAWGGPAPFVSTKAGKKRSDSPDIAILDYSPIGIRASVEESLRLLGLDVIDLLYLHDPVAMRPDEYLPAIDAMLQLRERGLVRTLGMGGHYAPDFEPLALDGTFSHFMGFNRYNAIRQSANANEYPKLRAAGVLVWQASPLYMGFLGNKYAEYMRTRPEWIPACDVEAAGEFQAYCSREGLDMAGLALNFVYRSSVVDRMVLGASRPQELEQSLRWLSNKPLATASLALHAAMAGN